VVRQYGEAARTPAGDVVAAAIYERFKNVTDFHPELRSFLTADDILYALEGAGFHLLSEGEVPPWIVPTGPCLYGDEQHYRMRPVEGQE